MYKKQRVLRLLVFAFLLVNLALGAVVISTALSGRNPALASYEFTSLRRGTLERSVSASGTINPVSTVRVLPQMSGKVERIFVDYNDEVRRGDILAELNTDMLRLRRDQQQAAVLKARANYDLQLINYRSQQALAARDLISEFELRSSRTVLDNQAADLAVAEANLRSIETEINQFAFITSPIDGIVLDRRINIGDTVVDSSSNNSSNIFTLAENLREMQIEAMVGELDIAFIQSGQPVRFSLESMPGRSFAGEVETIRMVPTVTNNVVSYTVIVKVENHDGSLMPGMTCAVDFIVERSENTLMVSNAALRYQPTGFSEERIAEMIFYAELESADDEQRQIAIEARAQVAEQSATQAASRPATQTANQGANAFTNLFMGNQPRMAGGGRQFAQSQGARQGQGRSAPAVVIRNLWYINGDGRLELMRVQTGITNGSFTEIHSLQDLEGMQVILRERI